MTALSLETIFDRFNELNALIVGDVMIDAYIWGRVDRISPEAPVPIVQVSRREKRLGGAANVALNVQAMGATPLLCSVIGNDADATLFEELLRNRGISAEGIVRSPQRITTIKERVLAGSQQMLRVDSEQDSPLQAAEEDQLLERIAQLLPRCQVLIFEDYDKGALTPRVISESIRLARSLGIPTVVDPKKRNFFAYEQATLFKPNLKELREGLKLDFEKDDQPALEEAVQQLKQRLQLEYALITLSERGVYIDAPSEHYLLPAHVRSISDVSGAGDTVVSIAALALALGLPPRSLAALANLGGGLVCEHVGVVPIDKTRLYEEAKLTLLGA
ncbi:bifunctional heptose 7-phosphate kinase/heptose 1-phosphate adenyltransferase [Cesiribacter andamanensis]|uniref:Bifunctional protein hldE n=1 Tax=Cesiribacter andamanensis AMV16 TaxID=1279009 RepID=M7N6E2_9BACT|nr:bifunctional ADP-heptose synthase [Cesiribacter andamanensis]EMR02847.1 Bifunctional protein hldE [Cesiribacter andamanensis AMV16]